MACYDRVGGANTYLLTLNVPTPLSVGVCLAACTQWNLDPSHTNRCTFGMIYASGGNNVCYLFRDPVYNNNMDNGAVDGATGVPSYIVTTNATVIAGACAVPAVSSSSTSSSSSAPSVSTSSSVSLTSTASSSSSSSSLSRSSSTSSSASVSGVMAYSRGPLKLTSTSHLLLALQVLRAPCVHSRRRYERRPTIDIISLAAINDSAAPAIPSARCRYPRTSQLESVSLRV